MGFVFGKKKKCNFLWSSNTRDKTFPRESHRTSVCSNKFSWRSSFYEVHNFHTLFKDTFKFIREVLSHQSISVKYTMSELTLSLNLFNMAYKPCDVTAHSLSTLHTHWHTVFSLELVFEKKKNQTTWKYLQLLSMF